MSENHEPTWRIGLNIVAAEITAERFREDLPDLRAKFGDDPMLIGGIYAARLITLYLESTGLFAALELPPEAVPAALAEIRKTLAHLDFDANRRRLRRQERRYYDRFAERAALLIQQVGEVMEALFNCYVAGDYDPTANPDALVAEALEIAEQDLERAQRLIAQAGAIALHGRPLYWRWKWETYGPAASWLITLALLIDGYTNGGQNPLGSPQEARARFMTNVQRAKEMLEKEEEEELPPEIEPSPIDKLIDELIERGQKKWTPEQLALCQAHREEAIAALIELASDEELQLEDAPGEGYAPIRAVELLGELQAVEAVQPLIDIVATIEEPGVIIHDTAISALRQIGPPALEPVLTFMRYSPNVEAKLSLAEVVAEIGQRDEQAYQVLLDLWDEATWEEGRCLLAHALVTTGGEQAIPVLQAALESPDLDDLVDYNEVADALAQLGVEAPPPPPGLAAPFGMPDPAALVQTLVQDLADPEYLSEELEDAPEELYAEPERSAYLCVWAHLKKISVTVAIQIICEPANVSQIFLAGLLDAVETLTFDASTKGYPNWLRQIYRSLAEEFGPLFQRRLAGILYALRTYLAEEYDIAEDADQLLLTARTLDPDDEELLHLFSRAGALALHGRSIWSRWPLETDPPLSDWLFGLFEFRRLLERTGHIPLRPGSEEYTSDLPDMMMKAAMDIAEPPAPVAELLDLLTSKRQDTLSPSERRRFAQQQTAVVPHLIRMVENKAYWYEEGPGEGWAAILAARLLGEFKAIQAADTLVSAVADSQPNDVIHEAALFSLMAIGRPALAAVQAYFRYGRNITAKASLAEVLGRIGQRSADSFDLLRQVWEEAEWRQNRRMVALAFGDLGDRRAIPLLKTALEDRDADALDLDYVAWALQRLGAPVSKLPTRSARLKTLAPYTPRLLYDEDGSVQRLKHTAWGEPLCPDCGKPLVVDEDGEWVHPPEPTRRAAPAKKRRRKRR